MYINKIDSLIDKIIDDFYTQVINRGKEFPNIIKESNFIKYQPQINSLLLNYSKSINEKDITSIINNQDSVSTVTEMIKRYICYYFFLSVGFFYKNKLETFINNVIEFSKNQPSFKFKVDNFFTSETNANIIKYLTTIKYVAILLELDENSNKIEELKKNPLYKDAFKFLNGFSKEFINKAFRLKNLKGDKNSQAHNLIKTVILNEIYYKQEKKDISEILYAAEKETGVYAFIDIVVPVKEYIDFNMIENVLSQEDIDNGLAYEIFDMIEQDDVLLSFNDFTYDDKIKKLLEHKLVVPVVDDFLLYHKDTEKYEKIEGEERVRKKEDIKIKYIVTKIDRASDLYSDSVQNNPKLKENTLQLFNKPLSDRNAVLINNNEDIKIISKLLLQGKRAIENNEFYNDLVNYRKYPFINFKDFQKDGFSINLEELQNPIDIIRYISFDKKPTTYTKDKYTQFRVGSRNQVLNIVGLIIPANTKHLFCLERNSIQDIRDFKFLKDKKDKKNMYTITNGYQGIIKFLKHTMFKRQKYSVSTVWMFDNNKDKVVLDKYIQTTKTTPEEITKLTVSKLYDDILEMMFIKALEFINKKKNIHFYDFNKLIRSLEANYMPFPKESPLYQELRSIIFYSKYKKTKKEYDTNEDEFPGLYGDIIKLPIYKKKSSNKVPVISVKSAEPSIKDLNLDSEDSAVDVDDIILYNAVCEHNHVWDIINATRKKNPNMFNKLVFEFVYQYIIKNNQDEYICKSCGTQVNITNYVKEAAFDKDNKLITFHTPMSIPLEDVLEYEKYGISIRSIDKLIDRLSSISKIPMFSGGAQDAKARRRDLTKSTIDMLLLHNNNMKKFYKERTSKIQSLYGIDKSMTSFWVFELDNSIFTYSTKDKDYFKPIKQNNVLVYIIFFMILQLNDTQILNMVGDKTCNFYWFQKYGYSMFDNLKILVNNKNNTEPIQNYVVLCYLLYYISCAVTKYSMWFYESDTREQSQDQGTQKKIKKFNPIIQRKIVNTLIDFINSVLEIYSLKKHNYLYTVFSSKFFQMLKTTFSDKKVDGSSVNIIDKLKKFEESKIVVQDGKKKYIVTKIKSFYLTPYNPTKDYRGTPIHLKCPVAKDFIPSRDVEYPIYNRINNIIACEEGTFHNWDDNINSSTLTCTICNKQTNTIKYDSKSSEIALDNYKYNRIRISAEKYCISGKLHTFIVDSNINCNVCTKCKFIVVGLGVDKISKDKLDILQDNIIKMKEAEDKKIKDKIQIQKNKLNKKLNYYKDYILEVKEDFKKTKTHKEDYFSYLNKFINHIEAVIGKDVNINSDNIYLRYDTYIINHDHNGYPLENNILVVNKENRIKFKKNDPFFKKDVLYYTNFKTGRTDVFYDSTTYLLLGYKQPNKEYQLSKLLGRHLTINYSILNKLKMLGYSSKYIHTKPIVDKFKKMYKKASEQEIIKKLIIDVSHDRIINLKQTILDIQRYINRIKYNFEEPKIEEKIYLTTPTFQENTNTNINPKEKYTKKIIPHFTEKYKSKLKKIKTKDNQSKFFKDWKALNYGLYFKDLRDKTINLDISKDHLLFSDIADYDYHGNIILYYITEELDNLIKYNHDRFEKINTVFMILDIINNLHNKFNKEDELTNYELKRFTYLLNSKGYVYDIEEKGHGVESGEQVGVYGEYRDEDDVIDPEEIEQRKDDAEEEDAIDYNYNEDDYEIDYVSGVNI